MKIFKKAVTGMFLIYAFLLLAVVGLIAFVNALFFAI